MFHRESRDDLQSTLAEIDAKIAAHPLSSSAVREAQAVVEANGGEKDAAARELAQRGLLSLEELGRLVARGTASWWNLPEAQHGDEEARRSEQLARLLAPASHVAPLRCSPSSPCSSGNG